jgi:hypothetical protein
MRRLVIAIVLMWTTIAVSAQPPHQMGQLFEVRIAWDRQSGDDAPYQSFQIETYAWWHPTPGTMTWSGMCDPIVFESTRTICTTRLDRAQTIRIRRASLTCTEPNGMPCISAASDPVVVAGGTVPGQDPPGPFIVTTMRELPKPGNGGGSMPASLVGTPVDRSELADSTTFTKTGAVAGNYFVISFASFLGVGLSSVDDGGSVLDWQRAVVKAGANDQVEIWYARITASGDYTVTVDLVGSGAAISGAMVEVDGLPVSGALDKTASADSSGTSVLSGSTGTLAQADEILFAAMTHDGSNPSITEEGGWTLLFEQEDNNNRQSFAFVYKVTSATTAEEHDWTIGQSVNAHGVIMSLKADGGAPPAAFAPPFARRYQMASRKVR